MKKVILFAALAMGVSMTSCIDNDEPESLEALRTAQANKIQAEADIKVVELKTKQLAYTVDSAANALKVEKAVLEAKAAVNKAKTDLASSNLTLNDSYLTAFKAWLDAANTYLDKQLDEAVAKDAFATAIKGLDPTDSAYVAAQKAYEDAKTATLKAEQDLNAAKADLDAVSAL